MTKSGAERLGDALGRVQGQLQDLARENETLRALQETMAGQAFQVEDAPAAAPWPAVIKNRTRQ
jgi:hypothetical protein